MILSRKRSLPCFAQDRAVLEVLSTDRALASEEMERAARHHRRHVLHRSRETSEKMPTIAAGLVGLHEFAAGVRGRGSADDESESTVLRDRGVGVRDRVRQRRDPMPAPVGSAEPERVAEGRTAHVAQVAGERWIARDCPQVAGLSAEDEEILVDHAAAAMGAGDGYRGLLLPRCLGRPAVFDGDAPVLASWSRPLGTGAADGVQASSGVKQDGGVAGFRQWW